MAGYTNLNDSGHVDMEHQGKLFPGAGVGALVLGVGRFPRLGDQDDYRLRFLMGLRGPLQSDEHPEGVRNEPDCWDIPGGGLDDMYEPSEAAVRREILQELGHYDGTGNDNTVTLETVRPLWTFDHFPDGLDADGKPRGQRWISQTFVATLALGSKMPRIAAPEREKIVAQRYFTWREIVQKDRDGELSKSMSKIVADLQDPDYLYVWNILHSLAPTLIMQ